MTPKPTTLLDWLATKNRTIISAELCPTTDRLSAHFFAELAELGAYFLVFYRLAGLANHWLPRNLICLNECNASRVLHYDASAVQRFGELAMSALLLMLLNFMRLFHHLTLSDASNSL